MQMNVSQIPALITGRVIILLGPMIVIVTLVGKAMTVKRVKNYFTYFSLHFFLNINAIPKF